MTIERKIHTDFESQSKDVQKDYNTLERTIRQLATLSGSKIKQIDRELNPKEALGGDDFAQQEVVVPLLVAFNILNHGDNYMLRSSKKRIDRETWSPNYMQLFVQFWEESKLLDELTKHCTALQDAEDIGEVYGQMAMMMDMDFEQKQIKRCSKAVNSVSTNIRGEFHDLEENAKKAVSNLDGIQQVIYDAAGDFNMKLLPKGKVNSNTWVKIKTAVEIRMKQSDAASVYSLPFLFNDYYLNLELRKFCTQLSTEKSKMQEFKLAMAAVTKMCSGKSTPEELTACFFAARKSLGFVKG